MRVLRIVRRLVACYAAGCVIIGAVLGEIAFRPARIPVTKRAEAAQALAGQFGGVLEDVAITASDEVRLQGWFIRPAADKGNAVILLHGVGDNRQGMLGIAATLLANGYAVLLPDSRGHGESGGFPTYGIKETEDVSRWCDWLIRQEKPRCIYAVGESMGAAIVLCATKQVRFCAVVAESPFASFREAAYLRVGQFVGAGSWVGRVALRPAVEFAFLYGRLTRGVWLSDSSPELSVTGSPVPVFLIHGLADENIPFNHSEKIFSRNRANIKLWEVPGAGHCGARGVARREFDMRLLNWFWSHPQNHGS